MNRNSFIIRIDRDNYKIPDIMKYSLIYLTTTVLLFFFGPISWKVKNPGIVIIYLVLYEIALGLGYKLGRYSKRAPEEKSINDHQNITEVEKVKINRLIVIGIVFDLLMVVRMANTFNLSIIFQKVFNGLNSPAAQYKAYYEEATAGNLYGGSLFSLFITLGAPFCIAGIILGIFYFKDLKTSGKSLCVLLIIIHLSSKLISSANEGIFDTVLYIVVSMFLRVTNESLTKVRKPSTNTRKKVFFKNLWLSNECS